MSPVRTVSEVFDAIQQTKAGAPDFCTNFFPVQRRLQEWIDHQELQGDFRPATAFFFRRDRDFHHLYFCAASQTALQRELAGLAEPRTERLVLDLVGQEAALHGLLTLWEKSGFRRYSRLFRMARTRGPADAVSPAAESPVTFAAAGDAPGILALLERAFDRFAEQLPTHYEIEAAVAQRQILVARRDGVVAGLLFFETQGFTSTLRFWAVAEEFRALRLGSVLMREYFATQFAARRFVLWVAADNLNTIQKYRHYGYAPDGLVDYILANALIPS